MTGIFIGAFRTGHHRGGATAVALAALLVLAGCATPGAPTQGWRETEARIRSYYRNAAWERNAMCVRPEMRGISSVRVTEETAERMVMQVRYAWDDESMQGNRRYGGNGSTGPSRSSGCTGFGERTFVLTPVVGGGGTGWAVASMSP